MNTYNGFSADLRGRAQRWLEQEWKAGRLARPTVCCACGQDRGIIDAHAEDYSEPFGPHLQRFGLCYRCHMMLHCRWGNGVKAWNLYRAQVREGARYLPLFTRDFGVIRRALDGRPLVTEAAVTHNAPPTWFVLDEIHAAKYAPRRR